MALRLNRLVMLPVSLVIIFYTVSLIKLGGRLISGAAVDEVIEDDSPVLTREDEEFIFETPLQVHSKVVENDFTTSTTTQDVITDPTTTTPSSSQADVQLLHILSYQRSGSSFVGRLFDGHPNAFFIYEPLSMLFTALYGIMEDRAIPNNIFFDHVGAFRNLTEDQSELMTWTMKNIFECRLSDFPVAMLISNFWFRYQDSYMSIGKNYINCIQTMPHLNFSAGDEGLGVCLEHIRKPCPRSYNSLHDEWLARCESILWRDNTWTEDDSDDLWEEYKDKDFYVYRTQFSKYFTCLKSVEQRVRQCARDFLDTPCQQATLRVVKTVRAPIEVSRKLFEVYPDRLSLVHLLRDPRGVTLSRLRAEWAHGYFERQDPDPRVLSDSYCRNALRDAAERKDLESSHAESIKEVVYDHFMIDPSGNSRTIFKMLGMEDSLNKINHVIEDKADLDRKDRWKTWLKLEDIRSIEKSCSVFMQAYNLPPFKDN